MANLSFEQFKQLKARGLSNDQIRRFSTEKTVPQPQKQDFLTSIRERVGFNPAKEILNIAMPASRGIPEQTIREYGEEPAASFVNQALLNAPRSLMAKGGQTFPEENAVSRIAGFAGGVFPIGGTLKSLFAPASMAKTAAKSPQVMTALRGLKGADMGTKIKTVLGMAGKMGLTGAAYGAAYSPEDFTDVGARGRQALAGGIMGAGVGVPATIMAEKLAVPTVKFARKFMKRAKGKTQFPSQDFEKATSSKMERAKTGASTQEELLKKQIDETRQRTTSEILPLEQESEMLKAQEGAIGNVFNKKKQIYEKAQERVGDYAKRRATELDSELTKVAESTALNSKQRIKDFNKNFNEKFGSTLDDISQGLSERGAELTAGELSETMSNIRNKMEQNGLKTGAKFESLAKRISELAPDQPLDLKYITNEMKQVRPNQGKLTRAVTGVEDVGINDLQGWFLDWVESVAPEYKDLTSKSKTVIQVRNYLASKAKPGEVLETPQMVKMIKDLAEGKLSSADKQRINILEQGYGTSPLSKDGGGIYNIKESPIQKQRRIRGGFTELVDVDAKQLKDAIEKRGEPIDWSKERLQQAIDRKETDAYPIVTITERGLPDVTDGGHRIAAAAQRGQKITISTNPKSVSGIKKVGITSTGNGETYFPGAGEFTGQVKQKGQQIQQFQSNMDMAQKKLAESTDALSVLETTKKNEISRKIQDIQDTIDTKKKVGSDDIVRINSELDNLTSELNAKIENIKAGPLTGEKRIRKLKDSVSAINVIRKSIGVVAGTAIGTTVVSSSLRSIGRALRYNVSNE